MEQIRAIIAANISELRLRSGMTQQELAEKLNYTDKAVSKWERGESVPDISVLAKVASIFGVTVDHLITDHRLGRNAPEEAPAVSAQPGEQAGEGSSLFESQSNMAKLAGIFGYRSVGKFTVTLMAAAAVWLIAVIVFVCLTVFVPGYHKAWICFVFAAPLTAIVLLIFNLLWGSMRNSFALMAVCVWTILAALFTFFIKSQPWIIFLIGIPAQAIILLWQLLYNRKKHK